MPASVLERCETALVNEKGYNEAQLPSCQTIESILNRLDIAQKNPKDQALKKDSSGQRDLRECLCGKASLR